MQPDFVTYQKQVILNAQALAKGMTDAGYRVVSGGTDTHVLLVDVFSKGLKGKEAERAFDQAWITVNKNTIPFDVNKPLNPSGIRLGSPAVTTRGFGVAEMTEVAGMIADVLAQPGDAGAIAAVRARVQALTARFPLYAWKMTPGLASK